MNDIDKGYSNTNEVYKPMHEKDGRIKCFIKRLEENGFIVQEGKLQYIDILKLVSEGKSPTALGNIVGAPYATYLLPPAPNQMPSPGQRPPKAYDPDNPNNYPPNLDFIKPGLHYKLRPDEAIVLIGQTPPPSVYFCFRSYLALVENKPEKNYRNAVTAGEHRTGYYHFIGASLGDQINNYSIWTDNTPFGASGRPFNSSTIIITTADKRINQHMRDALNDSGFCSGIINNDNIPIDLVNMGLEKGKDHFSFVMRANIFEDSDIGWDYIYNLEKYFTVLRITPQKPYTSIHPWPIPALKAKETCTTEFQAIPTARNTLDYLRNQIISKYKNTEYDVVDLDFNLVVPDNYEGILQDFNVWIVAQYFHGFLAGFERFASGIGQLFSSERLPTTATQFASNAIYEDLAERGPKLPDWLGGKSVGQMVHDVAGGVGYMAPAFALATMSAGLGAPAAVTKGISALMVGSSAKGNAYNYALQQGYTKEQAETYSTLTGVSEAALQYALSGIRKLGGGLTGNIAEKAIRNINSAVLRVAVEMPILMGGEFSEELLQAALEPVIRNIAFDENNKFRLFTPENLYQGLIGALTVLPFELGPTIARNVKYEQLGHGVNEARKADDLIARALEMDPKTEAHKLARKLADGIIHKNEYNIGELLMAYAQAGGDMAFMKAPRAEMQGTETALSEQPEPGSYGVRAMSPEQIGQRVQERIQKNVQAQPYVVQKALVEGMSTLIGIETRLRAESRNINYNGFNVESSQKAYIDYHTAKGTTKAAHLGVAAETMAADIRSAIATGQLTKAEAGRLREVLSEIVGDVSLAQAYVDGNRFSSDIVHDTNVDINNAAKDNSLKSPKPLNDVKAYTDESLQQIIQEEGLDVSEFAALLDADRILTPEEKELIRRILYKIGKPKKGTVMQKVIPEKDIQSILNGDFATVRKSVAQASYVSKLNTFAEIFYGMRLDFDYTPFTFNEKTYGRIRYIVEDENCIDYSVDVPGYSYPYTGRGFLGTDKVIIPEYMQKERNFRYGDLLEIVDAKTGSVLNTYVYKNKWILKGGQ